VEADFKGLSYPRTKRPDYRIHTRHLTVRGLRALSVYVDLKRGTLAGFFPSDADAIE
jgi:hypothetical protein